MSGEMDPEALVSLREGIADNTGIRNPIPVPVSLAAELLADRDHWKERAELAEESSAKKRAELAEAKAKNAALREMERDAIAYKHAFERLAGRIIGTVLVLPDREAIDEILDACAKLAARDAETATLAKRCRDAVRVYNRKA